jgi:hypothetical protein
MPKGIVWTAVISALAGAGAFASAVAGNTDWVLATGFVSVASALLASRER